MTSIASVYSHNDTAKTEEEQTSRDVPSIPSCGGASKEVSPLEVRANTALRTYSGPVLFPKTTNKSIKLIS